MEDLLTYSFGEASVGSVRQVQADVELPEEWHPCDGTTQNSRDYPEFVRAMGIKWPTFVIPASERVPAGRLFVIKLGKKAPPPVVLTPIAPDDEEMLARKAEFERQRAIHRGQEQE